MIAFFVIPAARWDRNRRAVPGIRHAAAAALLGLALFASGCGNTEPGSSGSAEEQARAYIAAKEHTINLGRVDYEHVVALVALAETDGESSMIVDEIAKVAQEAHDQIDNFREELFKTGGDKHLSEATFRLSEGANELKNSMGALVAYSGNPNPATLAHFSTQVDTAIIQWDRAVDEVWETAHEHGAPRLEASHGRAAAKAAESVESSESGSEIAPATGNCSAEYKATREAEARGEKTTHCRPQCQC